MVSSTINHLPFALLAGAIISPGQAPLQDPLGPRTSYDTETPGLLFADIATTVDGGVNATKAQQAAALVGCGSDGGLLGVRVNASDPTYSGPAYPEGYTTEGILIKILASGA
ncbi:hypothetical protein ASPCAL14000 [Aspergillus calidoustus]|uniref:Uncharacterized protein n=1 Tax=Aspergillus calidoustus TaxID=454130 RepID=A0A0U5GI24_ASPCI|nr:hypothetical protein ASPCAL14000 [Aspergillus calidoustus]